MNEFRYSSVKQSLQGGLTLDSLQYAHAILMKGVVNAYGKSVKSGVFRRTAAYQEKTFNPYPPPISIEGGIKKILKNLKNSTGSFSAAVVFFYDFISLHPFEDGNSRMGSKLLSHVFESMGTPFPTVFSPILLKRVRKALRLKDNHQASNKLYEVIIAYLVPFEPR